eukprot:16226473-Heterocapsa_arctica.AAC.1
MRSLQNGDLPSVGEAASWLINHGISDVDNTGQSNWAQATASWCPLLTIGCSVPHFLRKSLPPQSGPG